MTLMEKPTGRRGFLKGAAIVGAGLVVGFRFDPRTITGQALAAEGGNAGEFAANAFIRIAPDSSVTILCKHIEFGQGPFTASPPSSQTNLTRTAIRSRSSMRPPM